MACCNPWTLPSRCICGEFDTPAHRDLGQCVAYRVKKDCEVPTLPEAPCDDTIYTVDYDPDAPYNFTALTGLFDESCLPILDEDAIQILTPVV